MQTDEIVKDLGFLLTLEKHRMGAVSVGVLRNIIAVLGSTPPSEIEATTAEAVRRILLDYDNCGELLQATLNYARAAVAGVGIGPAPRPRVKVVDVQPTDKPLPAPRSRTAKRSVFTYQCTNCQTKNKTDTPPEDCMLHCSRCGFLTVQTCEHVEARLR